MTCIFFGKKKFVFVFYNHAAYLASVYHIVHSQALSRSAFLTEYVTFQPCVQSITQSRRQPGNEPISMHVIYSESEEAAASSASMLGTPVIRSSLPPPSLPLPSLPSFSLPSSGETVCKPEGAKAEEKKTSECSFNISQSVW